VIQKIKKNLRMTTAWTAIAVGMAHWNWKLLQR